MIFIFILLTIASIITWAMYINNVCDWDFWGRVSFGVVTIIIVIGVGGSYSNYLVLKSEKVTIDQYKSALSIYIKNANIPTGVQGNIISDLTDKKYEHYQDQLAASIERYRRIVVKYNSALVKKRTMNDSIFWNWIVIGPDLDMKVIQMDAL